MRFGVSGFHMKILAVVQLKAQVRTHTRVSAIDPGHKQLWIGEEAVPYRDLILGLGRTIWCSCR